MLPTNPAPVYPARVIPTPTMVQDQASMRARVRCVFTWNCTASRMFKRDIFTSVYWAGVFIWEPITRTGPSLYPPPPPLPPPPTWASVSHIRFPLPHRYASLSQHVPHPPLPAVPLPHPPASPAEPASESDCEADSSRSGGTSTATSLYEPFTSSSGMAGGRNGDEPVEDAMDEARSESICKHKNS